MGTKSPTFIHSSSKARKQSPSNFLTSLTGIGSQRIQSSTSSFEDTHSKQQHYHPQQPNSESKDVGKLQHDGSGADVSVQDENVISITQALQPFPPTLAPIFRRAGREQHPSVESRSPESIQDKSEVEDSQTFDTDLNEDRRKRRRTISVEMNENLLVQRSHDPLQSQVTSRSSSIEQPNAIQRPSTPLQVIQHDFLVNDPHATEHVSPTGTGTELSPFLEQQTSASGISTNQDTKAVPFNASMDGAADSKPGSGPKTPRKTRTPKKILKLNANGKLLSSPQAPTGSAVIESPTHRKATSKKGRARGSKLVVMRYSTDGESAIGKMIGEILTGNSKTEVTQVQQKPPPPNVSKATHPFFLARNKGNTVVVGEATPTSPKRNQKMVISSTTPIRPSSRMSMHSFGDGPDFVSHRGTTFSRNPDALAPVWPPREFKRTLSSVLAIAQKQMVPTIYRQKLRKSKQVVALVSDAENILNQAAINVNESDAERSRKNVLRLPVRRLLSGRECLVAVDSAGDNGRASGSPTHPSVRDLRSLLPKFTPTFDEGKCESLPWTAKYAPAKAEQVLQSGREAVFLRDWIRSLTISAVDTGSSKAASDKSKAAVKLGRKKKRIKRTDEDLDGFVVSSDDEVNELVEASEDELALPSVSGLKRSAFRNFGAVSRQGSQEPPKNAILLSGPHGCGKTASVYAVSKELGFEVFETNPGSRRSAKDIFDKVGDMTQNHLVQRQGFESGSVDEQTILDAEQVQDEIASGRQGTMNAFFTANATASAPQKRGRPKGPASKAATPTPRPKKSQKQSLILIEEADILYEEDKTFWNAIMTLTRQSKRPIILTCSDESLIPFDDLSLEAILRFAPIRPEIAAEYLVTVAAVEGHIIGKRHASELYTFKAQDLRASITELNFWCQMAVGSTKGSLDWMFNAQKESQYNSSGERLRTTSIETYQDDMSLIPRHLHLSNADQKTTNLESLMLFAESELHIPIVDWIDSPETWTKSSFQFFDQEKSTLQSYSWIANLASELDIISSSGLKQNAMPHLDASHPDLSLTARTNYCEGYPLLEAFETPDYTNITSGIAAALGSRLLSNSSFSLFPASFIKTQIHRRHIPQSEVVDRVNLLNTLAPLETPPPVFPPPAPGRIAISLEPLVPTATLAADLAPYVRYIVAYDHRLEVQRETLLSVSQEGGGSSVGKRKGRGRTTKASRAALEGGRKEETRRENWFHRKVKFEGVMRTGGEGWTDKVLQNLDHQLTVEGGDDTSLAEVVSQATEEEPS